MPQFSHYRFVENKQTRLRPNFQKWNSKCGAVIVTRLLSNSSILVRELHILASMMNWLTRAMRGAAAPALFAMASFVCQSANAQLTSGALTGIVTDPTGAVVPNATIDATNTATAVAARQTSNSAGEYHFANLPIGAYDVTVNGTGFAPTTIKAIPIQLNRTTTQNFALQVGQTATSVEVTEAAAAIDTTTAQITNNYETRMTSDLPSATSGQGVINLSLLSAGVSSGGGVGIGEGPSVGGQRPRNNNFTIEGVDNNSKTVTGPLVYVPNDAVQEFTVLQNMFQPEFGHSSGGQFNTNVKSGTNEFHGAAYDYLQNRNLNAIDQAIQNQGFRSNPRYDQNRFGGYFGGPIKKNKLFFFGDFEYNPTGQAATTTSGLLAPTAAGYSTLAGLPGINPSNLKILQQYSPVAGSASTTQPYTLPNGGSINIPVGVPDLTAPNYQNWMYAVGSLDYNVSDRDQVRGRFIYNKNSGFPPSAEPELPVFYLTSPTSYYLATVTEYHNFTPAVTNELRLGYNRYNQNVPGGDFKFPGLDVFPNLVFDDLGIQLGPYENAPQFTIQNTYQITDNLSWIKGRHNFKFGFDGRKTISPQTFTQRSRGDYDYAQLTDFLYDLTPSDLAQRTTGNYVYYGDQIATYLYASDSWKVKNNLTLDFGLRWEFTSVPFAERQQSVNSLASVPGLITFAAPQPSYRNFAPRIGFAWSPGSSGTTSVRGGFGMAYDVLFDNLGILSSPPQFNQTVDQTCVAANDWQCPGGYLAGGGISPKASAGTLSAADARAFTSGYDPLKQILPYSLNWTLGVQHAFANHYTIEVRYVGTRGIHLPMQIQLNQQAIVTPGNSLPTYLANPGQAALDALPLTLNQLQAQYKATATPLDGGGMIPAYYNTGFQSKITAYEPQGWSTYHALDIQLDRRLSHGFTMRGAYTWSHNIDNSTAEVFATNFTPRRAEDFSNLSLEKASSALDHRQRLTLTVVYDAPWFSHSNSYLMKNLVGNWEIAPIYTYQTGEYYTVQSGLDSNLNGDTAPDRAIDNPKGVPNTSTTVSPLKNSAGQTVAYVANNPNAQYIQAGSGAMPNIGRNTLAGRPIDDIDITFVKRLSFGERYKLELQGQFYNLLNHPQFIAGRLNDVYLDNFSDASYRTMLLTGNNNFNNPEAVLNSNARSIQLALKLFF
jgi:hypothetical protein